MIFAGRKEILDFKARYKIPYDYSKIYIKVFNERKLARERKNKRRKNLGMDSVD
jgi:hypothetical protein